FFSFLSFLSFLSFAMVGILRLHRARSAPDQRHAEVAGHAVRPLGDLTLQAIPALLEMLLPEMMQLLRQPGERVLPARLHLVESPPLVRAKPIGKTAYFDFGEAVADR